MPNIPIGFDKLVERVESDRPLFNQRVSKGDLWADFCYCALFGPGRIEAEISFVYNLLEKEGLLSKKIIREYGWVNKTETFLKKKLEKVKEPAKERKIGAIKKILAKIWDLHETLFKADEVFNKLSITPDALKQKEKEGEIKDILVKLVHIGEAIENPYKIPDVGYTKAVLWLHSCGVGRDYAPDNNHTIRFLNECEYNASGWGGQSYVRKDYDVLMNYLKQVTIDVNKKTRDNYSVAEVSHAIFYYESTKSLIGNRYKKYYSPATMLFFLKNKKLDINSLADKLFDIQEVDTLGEELNEFISKNFMD